jgi:hypothetical protein
VLSYPPLKHIKNAWINSSLIDMASAAEPILASTLWASYTCSHSAPGPSSKRRKLATGLAAIDTALDGGLDHGEVTCISSQPDAGATEFTLALLVKHLLSGSDSAATVINSTLSFDIRKLHGLLVHEFRSRSSGGEDAAMGVLDRLKIMKVFDFVGLTEAVSEVRETLEETTLETTKSDKAGLRPETPAPRGTVGDSEGEEEEMLDDEAPSSPPPVQPPQIQEDQQQTTLPSHGLLIIDSISHLAAPSLKNNHHQGQALLTSFMRSLTHLSKAHDLCTILLNGTVIYQQAKEEAPSIFSSCPLRPALGKTFGYLVDVHLLVHVVPRAVEDAKAVYGNRSRKSDRDVEFGTVVEVLMDRYSGKEGRWCAFTWEADGRLKEVM